MRKYFSCLVVAGVLANQSVSFAAESSDFLEFYQQEAKVVTASKQEEKISEAPAIIQVVSADEIRKFGATRLSDVLARLTSVYFMGSHLFRDNIPSIRGDLETHNDVHTLVLIDGRPYRNSQSARGYPVYDDFPVESVDHIEIIRGPGSVLYGTGAFDGVINVITKDPKAGKVQAVASVGGGTFDTTKYTANVGKAGDDYKVYAGYQYFQTGGWDFGAFDARRKYNSADWAKKDMGANFKASYKNLKAEVFFASSDDETTGSLNFWPQSKISTYHVMSDLGYLQPLTDHWDVGLNFTSNIDNDVVPVSLPTDPTGGPLSYAVSKAYDYLTEITAHGHPMDNLNIVMGGTNNHQTGPISTALGVTNFPPYTLEWWTGYLQMDYKPIQKLKLIGGGQWNGEVDGKPNLVPRGGAIYNFNDQWGTKLLYGQAYREPFDVETHINIPNTLLGNPNLKPEQTAATDVNFFRHTEKSQSDLTFFYIKQTDLIIRVPSGQGSAQIYQNQSQLIQRGIELEQKLFPVAHLMLTGSYSYQDNRDNAGVYNTTLMPTQMVKAGATYEWPQGITLGVFNSYYTKRYDDIVDFPTRLALNPDARPYNWLTANLAFNLNKLFNLHYAQEYTLTIYGDNLFDEAVYDPEFDRKTINTIPALPGASVMATLSVKF